VLKVQVHPEAKIQILKLESSLEQVSKKISSGVTKEKS
jgi:hypothetical protein